MLIQRQSELGHIDNHQAREAVTEFLAAGNYAGKKILLLIPDNSRSGPVGLIFKMIYDCLNQKVKALDVLVALGTHQPMTEQQICARLDITSPERKEKYASVKFFNHQWDKPETFTSIGEIPAKQIERITGGLFREKVDVSINKLIFDYDEFFILGPVFPHEVVGFSGGHKYLFPGIAGSQIINFFHWLGAVITNPVINGCKSTPTRQVVEEAASFIKMPHKLFALVAVENQLKGIFIGDCRRAWEKAAELSGKIHILYKDSPFKTVLGIAPAMYEDIWTAGKVMYKLEPIVADGGVLIIYAPHIDEISYTHGSVIDQIGYHTKDYFLRQWDKFENYPHGVIAHSTHVKGIGTYIDGVEKPRVNVVLATKITRERCRKVNLGYMNPEHIDINNYENKEDKGIFVAHNAGEMLYKLSGGRMPQVPNQR